MKELLLKILNNKKLSILLFALLFFLLEYEYYDFVNIPFFQEKMGFRFKFVWGKFFIVKFLVAGLLYLNYNLKKHLYFVNSLFLIFLTFPVLIMYEFMPGTPFIISFSAILFNVSLWAVSFAKTEINIKNFKINKKYSLLALFAIAVLMTIPFFTVFGFKINTEALLFHDVYKIRAEAAEKSTILMSYFLNWLVKIIIPVGIILSIKQKKWFFSLVFVILQIYLFSTGAHKSVFFSLFLVVLMFLPSFKSQINFVLLGFLVLITASKLISITTGEIMPESIIVRRTFFLPAIIINDYFDFFKYNHLHLSHSVLKSFYHYPFELQPEQIISKKYFNSPQGHCNSGFISDGFMNFGYLGILLNIIGLTIVFKIIEILKVSHIFSGILFIIVYTFVSSYFLTSLLTHGVILFLLLAIFILRENE